MKNTPTLFKSLSSCQNFLSVEDMTSVRSSSELFTRVCCSRAFLVAFFLPSCKYVLPWRDFILISWDTREDLLVPAQSLSSRVNLVDLAGSERATLRNQRWKCLRPALTSLAAQRRICLPDQLALQNSDSCSAHTPCTFHDASEPVHDSWNALKSQGFTS